MSMETPWPLNKSHLNFKKHDKNCNFLIFADIKRHNFKYIGQFLIKFAHNNIGSLGFEILSPLTLYRPLI